MLTPSPQLIRLALPDGLPPAVYLSSFGCVVLLFPEQAYLAVLLIALMRWLGSRGA
jgi:hypothetical protein